VTSSGTDVGKTYVMLRLLTELRRAGYAARALKPVASGFDPAKFEGSDTLQLLNALGSAPSAANLDAVSPWRFAAPLSPDMAAAREGRRISFDELVEFCRAPRDADITLIEGIGGVMVPLDSEHTVLDWLDALRIPVLLVVGSYLGALSHALTAANALSSRRLELAGVVVSESPVQPVTLEETVDVLGRFLPDAAVVALPRNASADTASLLPLVTKYLGEQLHATK